jgi:large subunit ribosomal protein L29
MRTQEIRDRTDDELEALAKTLAEDLYKLRVEKATNQLENTASIKQVRRDLARLATVRRARNLKLEDAPSKGAKA